MRTEILKIQNEIRKLENNLRKLEPIGRGIRRVTKTLLAAGEVGIYSWPALQLALTAYAEKVHNVTIGLVGTLPYPTPGSPEGLAIGSILFLSLPIWKGYDIGKRWGIFKPQQKIAK